MEFTQLTISKQGVSDVRLDGTKISKHIIKLSNGRYIDTDGFLNKPVEQKKDVFQIVYCNKDLSKKEAIQLVINYQNLKNIDWYEESI